MSCCTNLCYPAFQLLMIRFPMRSIIFISGIIEHPYYTWQSLQDSIMWIRDWLPFDLDQADELHEFGAELTEPAEFPDAPIRRPRIMVYGAQRSIVKAWWMHSSSQNTMRAEDISESPVISRDHLECLKRSRAHLVCR